MFASQISCNPQFIVGEVTRFDVQQGDLGDCWLLAATATLAQHPQLFNKVVPADNSFQHKYAGIFHFHFWQYGKWVEIAIDDKLPTNQGQLVFSRSSNKNEFWSALLEKAYAKLYGSYKALIGGTTSEAMEDFTGGIAEMFDLGKPPENIFDVMEAGFKRHSLISCNIDADPNITEASTPEGLVKGHAYSVTLATRVNFIDNRIKGTIELVRLRNPWGNGAEWKGAFSDRSAAWENIPKCDQNKIDLLFRNDGEFWMNLEDFLTHFDRLEICHLSPDSVGVNVDTESKKFWKITNIYGEWRNGLSAGGCRNFLESFWTNPQYILKLAEPDEGDRNGLCTVVIALMQMHRRSNKYVESRFLPIGFNVYKVNEWELQEKPLPLKFFKYKTAIAQSSPFVNVREVSCRFNFPPGNYLIVPSTFLPECEGEFLIRIFSESSNKMVENELTCGQGHVDNRVSQCIKSK